jgi:hypothetical protein
LAKTELYLQELKKNNYDKKALKDSNFKSLKYKDYKANLDKNKQETNVPFTQVEKLLVERENLAKKLSSYIKNPNFFDNYNFNYETDGRFIKKYFNQQLLDDDANIKIDPQDLYTEEEIDYEKNEDEETEDEETDDEEIEHEEKEQEDMDDEESKKMNLLLKTTNEIRKKYRKIRLFSLLPHSKRLRLNYIPFHETSICMVVCSVIKCLGNKVTNTEDAKLANLFNQYHNIKGRTVEEKTKKSEIVKQLIDRYFNINSLLKSNERKKLSYNHFESDGKCVSIVFKNNDMPKKFVNKIQTKFDLTTVTDAERSEYLQMDLIAADPGVSDSIFSFVKETNEETNKKSNLIDYGKRKKMKSPLTKGKMVYFFQMTKNDYYERSHFNRGRTLMKIFDKNFENGMINNIRADLPPQKLTSTSVLSNHINYMNLNKDHIMRYNKLSPARKWRYNKYVNRKRYFMKFVSCFLKNSIVAIGDFSQSSESKYKSRRGPINFFKKWLLRNGVKVEIFSYLIKLYF